MTDRPKRRAIPLGVKLEAALLALGLDPEATEFDHDPAIGLRPVNATGDDYDPPQLDPKHIVPRAKAAHARKTDGPAHDRSQGDKGRIEHTKRLERKQEVFARVMIIDCGAPDYHPSIYAASKPKRAFPKGRKIQNRGFQRRVKP